MQGNSPADDCRLNEKISRRDFLKLIFSAPLAITLLPLIQLTRVFGSNVSNANVINPYRVGELDKFGIKQFYSTKENGLEWFADWDKARTISKGDFDPYDSRFGIDNGSDLKIEDGKAKIRGFSSARRFYVKGPWLNTEQTIYIRLNSDGGKASSIQLRSRSNHHGTLLLPYPNVLEIDKGGGNYDKASCGFAGYLFKWGEGEPINFASIELEVIHALYRRDLIKVPLPFTIPIGEYVGYKTITKTLENGYVKLEGWTNIDVSSQDNWKKTAEFTFDGKNSTVSDDVLIKHQIWTDYCKDKGDKISGDLNNHQIWNKPSYWNWIRINNAENIDLKFYSVREIE